MPPDFALAAFKTQIITMMKFLGYKAGDVVFISGVDIRPFETVYCDTGGYLYGSREGGRIPISPNERFYKQVHSILLHQCRGEISRLDSIYDLPDLSLLLKKFHAISFIDL